MRDRYDFLSAPAKSGFPVTDCLFYKFPLRLEYMANGIGTPLEPPFSTGDNLSPLPHPLVDPPLQLGIGLLGQQILPVLVQPQGFGALEVAGEVGFGEHRMGLGFAVASGFFSYSPAL
jgi:hypothetical protein